MKKYLLVILLTSFHFTQLISQCELEAELNVDFSNEECCGHLTSSSISPNSTDSLDVKLAYYRLLCHDLKSDQIKTGIELFRKIVRNIKIKEKTEKNSQFVKDYYSRIKQCDYLILKKGYKQSLLENNELNAWYFADNLSNKYFNFYRKNQKSNFDSLAYVHIQNYAGGNFIKLIPYYAEFLMKDTNESLNQIELKAYHDLVDLISSQITANDFKAILDEVISNSTIVAKEDLMWFEIMSRVDLDLYSLKVQLDSFDLEYFNYDASMLYHKDTIVNYITEVYYCGANYQVEPVEEIISDTIRNKIDNFDDMIEYRSKFTNSYLYSIVGKMKN